MTTRYMKPYDIAQNKRLDILSPNEEEETYFQSFLNKYAPSLRTQYDVEKRLIAKQERNEWIGETSDAQLRFRG